MDILTLILSTLRRELEQHVSPIDGLDDAMAQAVARADSTLRASLGGGLHLISRLPEPTTAERIAQLAATHTTRQIADLVGVSDRHVRRVVTKLRRPAPPTGGLT